MNLARLPLLAAFALIALLAPLTAVGASELRVTSVISADGQDTGTGNGSLTRLIGTAVAVRVQFSEGVTTAPDVSKIHVYRKGTTTAQGTSLAVTDLNSTEHTTWKLSFSLIEDGDCEIVFDSGAATSTSGDTLLASTTGSFAFTLDSLPRFETSFTRATTSIRVFSSNPRGASEYNEAGTIAHGDKISVVNGFVYDNGSIDTYNLYYDIQPRGYGTVKVVFGKGYLVDKWGNQTEEVVVTIDFPAPSSSTAVAPKIISISGVEASNRTYRTGDTLTLLVQFDRAVKLNGDNPHLLLNSTGSGAEAKAVYASGAGTTTLQFTYTILANQASPLLDLASTTAFVNPNGSSVVGTGTPLDYIANVTVTKGTLPSKSPYGINTDPAKSFPEDIEGVGQASASGCGAGSGVAVLVLGLALGTAFRRRSAARSAA